MEYIPYTYLVGWTKLNKFYYGVEYALIKKIANPINFWTTYFTSSNIVLYLRESIGEPDIIQIRKQFNSGSNETRSKRAIMWEKTVLTRIDITNNKWLNGRIGGDICPATNAEINMLRYGVENVFSSNIIKDKIKRTNMKRYGVDHPSKSKELLEKKARNNIKKYGVSCTLQLPHIQDKMINSIRQNSVQQKIKQTNLNLYGVEFTSQRKDVKEKVIKTRNLLYSRDIVIFIKEYKRVFNITLTCGWYQLSNEKLTDILNEIQNNYGFFTYEELLEIKVIKKYSQAIKKLQDRVLVQKIQKYKDKYGTKNIKLEKNWYRKDEEYLNNTLENLIIKYGIIQQ